MSRDRQEALNQVKRIEQLSDFIEHPDFQAALKTFVPTPVPAAPGAWGFDVSLWVGFGTVGLWAALDAFAERAILASAAGRVRPADGETVFGHGLRVPRATMPKASMSWKTYVISTLTTTQE